MQCLYAPSFRSSCKVWLMLRIDKLISPAICFCLHSGFHLRLIIHLSQNIQKQSQNRKNKKHIAGYFAHFASGSAFARKLKRFYGLFFCDINKTQNLHEMRKVYSECFVFCGVFCKNICEIPAKWYEKCRTGLTHSRTARITFGRCTQRRCPFLGPWTMSAILSYPVWGCPHLCNTIITILFSCFPKLHLHMYRVTQK